MSGSNLLYADYIAGSSRDTAAALAVAPNGSAYLTGTTTSMDFPTQNPYQATLPAGGGVFVSELSADGATLTYSTYLGGSSGQSSNGIAVSASGQIVVAGETGSADFPLANAYQSSFPAAPGVSEDPQAAFLTEFSADGSTLIFSTYLTGTTFNGAGNCYEDCELFARPVGLALDTSGNVFVAGSTDATDFPTTASAYDQTYPVANTTSEEYAAFVAKFTSAGALSYSTYFGASGTDGYGFTYPQAMAADPNGEVYLLGETTGTTDFPSVAAGICGACTTYSDQFLTKFSSSGASLVFSTLLPVYSSGSFRTLAVDGTGNIFLLGVQGSAPPVNGLALLNPIEGYSGQQDVLLSELDPGATTELFSTLLGGVQYDSPSSLTIDTSNAVYIVGITSSSDFPVTESGYQQTNGGSQDAFLSKIDIATDAPAVAIAPSLLQYSVRDVGSTAQVKSALLRNMGTTPLLISSIKTSGDFTETDTCGQSVPAGGNCDFTVTFSPTAPGSRFGTILITDNAVGSPHFINLSGVGATPVVSLDKTSLTFTSLAVSVASAVQTITLTNTGNATLNIGSIQAAGDFAETNNCPASVALGASCTISVTFTPTAGGTRTGSLTFTDNAADSPEAVALTGSGYVTTVTLSKTALAFGSINVNIVSAPQAVTVTNTGKNPMIVTAVVASANFAQTNNCTTIAPNASCTVNVTFKPLSSGALTGTVLLSDNAQGNPHQLTLSGTGVAPAVSFSAASLTFGTQNAGTSATRTLTITNSGNAPLTFGSILVQGDYSQTNNCTSVAASASCTVTVTFDPTANGIRSGNIIFTDGAGNSPQTVALSGTGVDGLIAASPSTLSFTSQPIGSPSSAQTITLTNVGTAPMPITSIVALGSFTETNNCPASLAEQVSCMVNVSFVPLTSGAATGAISLNGSTSTIPVSITGMGSDFSLTAASSTSTESPGTSATYTLNVAPVGGAFSQAITLTCTGAPVGSTCTLTPASVTPGSATVPVSITVTTEAANSGTAPLGTHGKGILALFLLHANGLALAIFIFGVRRGQVYRRMFLFALIPFVLGTLMMVGCGGKSTPATTATGTPAGTYGLTVVGTAGNLQHFTSLTMQVQ